MSPNPEKLLIVDGHTPPAETEPYLDYYVKQNLRQQQRLLHLDVPL